MDEAAGRPLVLVVEDEPFLRDLLRHALPQFGLGVLRTAGGVEVRELYRPHRGASLWCSATCTCRDWMGRACWRR